MLKVNYIQVGMLQTNCYLIQNEETKESFLVDPGAEHLHVSEMVKNSGTVLKAVLLTHGHFDHIFAVPDILKEYQVPLYASATEQEMLQDPKKNLSEMYQVPVSVSADRLLKDGEEFELCGFKIRFIETPGHTKGAGCYYLYEENVLISGDTLFRHSYGVTAHPEIEARSIREKLFVLPEETDVLPGHQNMTRIGEEKKVNPIWQVPLE